MKRYKFFVIVETNKDLTIHDKDNIMAEFRARLKGSVDNSNIKISRDVTNEEIISSIRREDYERKGS